MSEGSQWEAVELAAYYKLDNLIGIIDVNRLGQRGEIMYGRDLAAYEKRVFAFGWKPLIIRNGHAFLEILQAYHESLEASGKPVMLIAGTIKGKGVSQVEDQNGWHGKALKEEDLEKALEELGEIDTSVRGEIKKPEDLRPEQIVKQEMGRPSYSKGDSIPTRNAYGNALKRIFPQFPNLVSLDGEVSNSTRAEYFKEEGKEK